MNKYRYHPIRFYITVFIFTWAFWFGAIFCGNEEIALTLMFFGLCVPAIAALITVLSSKNSQLINDLKQKVVGFYRINVGSLFKTIIMFAGIVAVSIIASTLVGQSLKQFAFTDGFSFSIGGSSALLTILLASIIEELGWRGYGEDAIANYCSWFKESILFGLIWAFWHLPLFFIDGTYHAGLMQLGIGYVLNFFISVIALGFITTLVYVKNNRSMLACIIFHLFVNFFQEKIAMTPETKCVETIVIIIVAIIIVYKNKELFMETKHLGKLLEYKA